jgi:hypothetical protein
LLSDWTQEALEVFQHYGLDPDDRKYLGGRSQVNGWCKFCNRHSVDNPSITCDLEQARAADMAQEGFEASCCFHCRNAYPRMFNRAGICPRCQRLQDERDAEIRAKLRPRQVSSIASSGVRVADGLGCTEKLPGWMLDWDGDPNG